MLKDISEFIASVVKVNHFFRDIIFSTIDEMKRSFRGILVFHFQGTSDGDEICDFFRGKIC